MIKRVILFFPVSLFILIRQFYANLLGIDKNLLTAVLVLALSVLGGVAFQARMREPRRDFLVVDYVNLAQFHLAAIAICAYFVAGKIEANQAIYSVYYYCFAPFLIYTGFLLRQLNPVTKRAALVAAGCAYLVTFWVAVYESLGIEFWLFEYDRWTLQKNYIGIARASGLYGTQIDYGLLSFLVFTVAFYCNARRRHWFTYVIIMASALGVLLSMSRAWVAALVLVVLFHALRAQSLKRKLKIAMVIVVAGVLLFSIADRLGFVDMLRAADAYTQDSNEARIEFIHNTPKWLKEFLLVGTGPGTQNGPDVHDIKFIGDFLWLATVIEFGTVLGVILVLLKMFIIGWILYRVWRLRAPDSVLPPIVGVACIAFLLASFIDSAYAHLVTISALYVIAGLFLHDAPARSMATDGMAPELQPA